VNDFKEQYEADLRQFTEDLLQFESTRGNEAPAQERFKKELSELGFKIVEWEADAEMLSTLSSFPDAESIKVEDRNSVAGILELNNPDDGPTLVLNGHMDVVPVDRSSWETDPFDPVWDEGFLTARGAADMKTNLALLVYIARYVCDEYRNKLDGRIVVESVTGEEEGGIGAPMAAIDNLYDFERDAAIIAEPTDLSVVTATEGVLIMDLTITGRSAHAATRWRGESVLPHFDQIREAFLDLEEERHARERHPLYEYPINWPVNISVVNAGDWASSVPSRLEAMVRIGVSPRESLSQVEAEFYERMQLVVEESEWLSAHSPTFERSSIQFEPFELDAEEPIVRALCRSVSSFGKDDSIIGKTYSSDSRFYNEYGIPTVLFGPGTIDQAHFPNETIEWREVLDAAEILTSTCVDYLSS
jgi:acetylornithine deacetylase